LVTKQAAASSQGVGHDGPLNLVTVGVAMMVVLGASVLAINMARQQRQIRCEDVVGEIETMQSRRSSKPSNPYSSDLIRIFMARGAGRNAILCPTT